MTDIVFIVFLDAYAKTIFCELRGLASMVDLCIEDMKIMDIRAFI